MLKKKWAKAIVVWLDENFDVLSYEILAKFNSKIMLDVAINSTQR